MIGDWVLSWVCRVRGHNLVVRYPQAWCTVCHKAWGGGDPYP